MYNPLEFFLCLLGALGLVALFFGAAEAGLHALLGPKKARLRNRLYWRRRFRR